MKLKNRATLIGIVIGTIAGAGSSFLLPGAHWGIYVGFGFIVAAGATQGATRSMLQNSMLDKLDKQKL